MPPIEDIANVTFVVNGADLEVTFDVTADGDPALGYDTVERGYRADTTTNFVIDAATLSLADNGGGNYTLTVPGAAADEGRYLFRISIGGDRDTRTYFYGDYGVPLFEPVAHSAQACANCHGPEGIDVHGGYFPASDGGEPCLVCHGVVAFGAERASLGEATHKYHSGIWEEDGEFIDVTYPTYMTNCSVCHDSDATLAAVNAMPVSGPGCFTCHGDINGFGFEEGNIHLGIADPETADCTLCHNDAIAFGTVAGAHNGAITERDGVIYDGVDTSVTEGAKIDWQIIAVVDDGVNLEIDWVASYDADGDGPGLPVGVDPCNATAGPGAPVFFADGEGNLSILRNYAQGEDFILGTREDRAGQPGGTPGVSADNTTCESLVATTIVPVEETDAMYGRVAIQGKPRVPNVDPTPDPDFAEEYGALMPVRAFTPTYDWVIGDGAAAPARRAIVDSAQCLKCHVGSMYQHGGNRVDNVDMCYLCHNPAANDQYVRIDTFDVDASEAYDGRAGQNFGMKEMLHAVHSAGETGAPIVIYRGRGIYAWAGDVSLLSNWPGSGRFPVFGSDDGTGNPVEQNHTFHTPTYPRSLNECGACHVDGFEILPSALKAMASTIETGDPPFGDQVNDILEGAQTSSCMTCHRSDDPSVEASLKAHAYQNGWVPREFPEGRQTIIDAVK